MKKIVVFLLTLTMLTGMTALAKTGDVIGKIYATDIKAYINGIQVDSYNIGGKTVVIIEDITTQCEYSEEQRQLLFWDLSPEFLVTGNNSYAQKPGTPIGNIYETDIKTFVRDKEIPCYSLNGKMAVAIEELGNDNDLSDIGGKFLWDSQNRTISLEFIHNNTIETLQYFREKHLNGVLTEENGKFVIEFQPEPILSGGLQGAGIRENNQIREILYNGELVGYRYKFTAANESYFFMDKIKAILKDVEPVQPTYSDWMTHFESQMYRIISEFETDEYHFLYMSQSNTHGSSQFLKKINKKEGTVIDYDANFKSVSLHGQKYFDNVTIDKENEKVYFGYDTNYVIDLETDEIEKVK